MTNVITGIFLILCIIVSGWAELHMNLFLLILCFKCCMFYVCKPCTLFFLFYFTWWYDAFRWLTFCHSYFIVSFCGRRRLSGVFHRVTSYFLVLFLHIVTDSQPQVASGIFQTVTWNLLTFFILTHNTFWYFSFGHMILSGIFCYGGFMILSGIFFPFGHMILSGIFCYGGFMILSGLFIMVTCYCTFWNLLYYSLGHILRFN